MVIAKNDRLIKLNWKNLYFIRKKKEEKEKVKAMVDVQGRHLFYLLMKN